MNKIFRSATISMFFNLAYGVYHFSYGFGHDSWWMVILGIYYLNLSVVRWSVLETRHHSYFIMKLTGVMFIFLSIPLAGTVILSAICNQERKYHVVIMIGMAIYTFAKITVAIVNFVQSQHRISTRFRMLRNISLANAFVSIFGLQRVMLVSFADLTNSQMLIFNLLTGLTVWIIVILLGVNLLEVRWVILTKSNLVSVNKKIAKIMVDGYKLLGNGASKGYKIIEKGFVTAYRKVENKYVDAYLAKEGESVQATKERIKKQREQ